MLSVERHVIRNFVFLYAIENELPVPIGTTDTGILDTQSYDADAESATGSIFDMNEEDEDTYSSNETGLRSEEEFRGKAAELYQLYASRFRKQVSLAPLATVYRGT